MLYSCRPDSPVIVLSLNTHLNPTCYIHLYLQCFKLLETRLSVPKHVQVIRRRRHSRIEEEQTAFIVGEQDSRTVAMHTPTYLTFLHNLYMSVLFRLPDRYSRDVPQQPMLNGHEDGMTQALYKRWVNEWTQMGSVASVLFGVLFTILQISSAAYDPIVRTVLWLSIVCLFFGATYAVILLWTFGKLEMNTQGLDWIRQVTRPPNNRFWNLCIMLSMPAAWISWGAISFAFCIVTFLWRSGATDEKDESSKPSPTQEYGPRFTATFIFILGAIYLGLIIRDVKMMGSDSSKLKV
ncbi:hypothetical protein FB451DRAFT_719502 [Mycena latifolia]|nr:hypothetical protein FB451DRAFT_719502 [Mycena latifolia]